MWSASTEKEMRAELSGNRKNRSYSFRRKEGECRMNYHIAARMDRMAPSGIRKVNEKALAMERAGERVLHFEIGRPDFDTPEYIKKAAGQALAQIGRAHV